MAAENAISDGLLRAKAAGFVDAISKMGNAERSETPKAFIGTDYNELRRLVLKSHPEWDKLVPPEVRFRPGGSASFADCKYADLMIFCSQLVTILDSAGG